MMTDTLYVCRLRRKLIQEGAEFKRMVVCLSCDQRALLVTIGEYVSGPISIFTYPNVIVRVNSGRDKRGRIDVAPKTIQSLLDKKLIEKRNWNEHNRSLHLTALGRVALSQLSV